MFLFFFVIIYLFVDSVIYGNINNKILLVVAGSIIIYTITMHLFPNIHIQYIDKSRLLLTVGEFLHSVSNIKLSEDLSSLLYQKVFVEKNILDSIVWSGFIYSIIRLIVFLHLKICKICNNISLGFPLTLPIIGNVRHIPHSIYASPFWIGPMHTLFSLIGIFKLNKTGKVLLVSAALITILPGSLVTASTGALREIFYLFIIIPITSYLGFSYVILKAGRYMRSKVLYILITLGIIGIFSTILVMPIIGNMHYRLLESGTEYEIDGLTWLRYFGSSTDGCTGLGYRQISIYSNKQHPLLYSVSPGRETVLFSRNLNNIYFTNNSVNSLQHLYSKFNIKYYISSGRVLKNFRAKKRDLKIQYNKNLDKIYTSSKHFDIFQYTAPKYEIKTVKILPEVVFNETHPKIRDAGSDFLIETSTYKIRLSKTSPGIRYLGDKRENFLGEGYLTDYIKISWYGRSYIDRIAGCLLSDMNFSTFISNNQIIYKGVLKSENENWATLIVKYTFYEKAIKNEMIVANDWLSDSLPMNLYFSTLSSLPFSYFTYEDWHGIKKKKRVYPSEDYSIMKNKKFKSILFNDGNRGIYIKYCEISPYPSDILYKGDTIYNYSEIDIEFQKFISPGDNLHITRYISIGDEDTTEKNVDRYLSVGLYPYQEGIIPLIITGYLERLNHSTEKELNSSFYVYRELKYANVTYTEGINMGNEEINKTIMNKLLSYGIDVIGYENFFYRFTDPLQIQKEKIGDMRRNARVYYNLNISGFIPEGLKYNLDTINASIDENITFIIATSVEPPIEEFNREGLRYPKIVYYHGNKTSLILLPVSNPTSSLLRPEYNIEDILSQWKSTIDSVIREDDLCIFLLRSTRIRGYMNEILDLIDYAKNKGMTFTTPEKIAEHFRLLQNIYATVSKDIDSVNIFIKNNNNRPVKGVTFRVTVPTIEWRCPYRAINGRITRIKREGLNCISYVTTNLSEKENKTVIIEPNITRREFNIEIPENPIEGKIRIKIMDEYNNSVGSALVTIENKLYKTDEDGVLNINLRRGRYTIKIEKPGFKTRITDLEVKGRIYTLFNLW
ncbi:MAG: hypothetical protein DRO95_03995 [Candidatus Altiarchaeales archaeon]|nr:MAG: hypothetical protein DRO95_03995 [Candidatus Altiarchaeales archaeon]